MQTRPVVIAAANLDVGAELRREDVRVIDWPAESVPAGTFSNPQEVVGRGLIQPIVQNAPILEGAMPPKEAGAGLPPVIPEGMRAVSVRVNEVIGVAGYVLPGTRVDVLATANPGSQPQDTTTKVILSNVQVLTAGTRMEQDADKGKPVQVTVVTLLVFPEQSERLALASTEGKIQLALRNPLDQGAPETPGVRQAGLLGAVRATAPVKPVGPQARRAPGPVTQVAIPVAATLTVEIIRGDKRTAEVIK
jgi:pilus assembly protein CpaB